MTEAQERAVQARRVQEFLAGGGFTASVRYGVALILAWMEELAPEYPTVDLEIVRHRYSLALQYQRAPLDREYLRMIFESAKS